MAVDIALKNLVHDKTRFLITLVGVTFSVVLVFAQFGIYLGFMRNASIIIDNTPVDVWITSRNSANFDFPLPFFERKLHKAKEVPGVAWADRLILTWASMKKQDGGSENVELIGFNPNTGIGGPWALREGSIDALKAGRGIIVDESAFPKLGRLRVGDYVEINENRVKVVGVSEGARGFTTAPYIFTSYRTAQDLDPFVAEKTVFIVARVAPGHDPQHVAAALRQLRDVDVFTRGDYSLKTRLYWTWETGIGVGFGMTAVMAIVVGMVIVSQTIYTATIEHLREFGTLKAIGARNIDVYGIIVKQAVINAVLGFGVGLAVTLFARRFIELTGLVMVIPGWLMLAVFALTLGMCLAASVLSVRKALQVDPLVVFRT
jgi:putative ABC transport system permease protein